MSDDQGHQPSGGDAGTERALDELRVALEQLATRMGAGFREDLAQIRAIAASVAERDLTADIDALRVDVAALVGRDAGADVRDELAAVRAELARLASGDDLAGVRAELAPLQASVDRLVARLDDDSGRTQVLARFEALEARLDQLAGGDGSAEVLARIDALSGQLGGGTGDLLEQLQDNLADVASGEVVGALWDEVRRLRADLPDLVAVPAPVVAAPVTPEPDPQLAALLDELAVLRSELDEGLVVEPSDALSASLDALRSEVDGLRDALGELRATPQPAAAPVDARLHAETLDLLLGEIRAASGSGDRVVDAVRAEVDGLRSSLAELRATPAPLADPVDDTRDEELLAEVQAIRSAVDALDVRLADGLAPTTPVEDAAFAVGGADVMDAEALADQIAALRDFVASELDTVQQTIAARLDSHAEATAATVAAAASHPEPEPSPATPPAPVAAGLDPDTVDMLRDEIRAAGAIGDQVVDALREELKALRRRIAVKATERVLDDQQLAHIADAVAARLATDG